MSAVEQSNSDAWRIDMTDEERCYYVETLEQIRFRCEEKCYSGEVEALDVAIEMLNKKPERARWMTVSRLENTEIIECRCSVCNVLEYFHRGYKKTNYCPGCGRDMREDDKNECETESKEI